MSTSVEETFEPLSLVPLLYGSYSLVSLVKSFLQQPGNIQTAVPRWESREPRTLPCLTFSTSSSSYPIVFLPLHINLRRVCFAKNRLASGVIVSCLEKRTVTVGDPQDKRILACLDLSLGLLHGIPGFSRRIRPSVKDSFFKV